MGQNERPLHTFRGFNVKLPGDPLHPIHLPERPSWDCKFCGEPWPCGPARENLLDEYANDPTGLAVLQWGHLEDWIAETGGQGPMREAWDRFLAWTRPSGSR